MRCAFIFNQTTLSYSRATNGLNERNWFIVNVTKPANCPTLQPERINVLLDSRPTDFTELSDYDTNVMDIPRNSEVQVGKVSSM